jgi:hypothetical protein
MIHASTANGTIKVAQKAANAASEASLSLTLCRFHIRFLCCFAKSVNGTAVK